MQKGLECGVRRVAPLGVRREPLMEASSRR